MLGSASQDGGESSLWKIFLSVVLGLAALAACVALCPLLILPLTWQEQAIFGAVLIAVAMLFNMMSRSLAITTLLMAFSIFSTLRYGYWRVVQTWEGITSAGHMHRWDTIFVVLLLGAEFFAFSTLILGYFQTLRPLQRPPLPLGGDAESWPTVDVLVPTYNEPLHVVKGTVLAAMALDYPAAKMRVLLLDDGRREEFRKFAAQVGVEYVTRDNNAHAKAGNINHALQSIRGEFVAIFDSDHVPARSFLQMTLGWFLRDRDLGLVQTPHHFYSPDPFERNLGQFRRVPNEGELFHRLVQDGNDLWNASFFCGSCAVLRRSALDEIGGIAVETVTEDAHTALRMQRRGWNTAYINVPVAAGLATESLAAHIGQRIRWARGMTQILRTENPLFASGLTLSQRLCYFNATTHFLFAVPRLIFLTIPLVYLLFGKVNIYGYTWAVVAYAFPHIVLSTLTNSRIQGRHRYSFWNEIYEVVLAPYILFPTLLALINPRLGRFNVTSKGGILRRSYFDRRIALPYLFLLALNVAGLVAGAHRYVTDPGHRDTVIMNAAWAAYNAMILAVAASVAWERRKLRSGAYWRARVPATLRLDYDRSLASDREIAGATVHFSRNSVALKLDASVELARGAPVLLELGDARSSRWIPALVAHSAGRRQDLFLPDLTDEQEKHIEGLLHLRGRVLRSFREPVVKDRPLRSLAHILGLALRGLAIVPIGLFLPGPPAEPEAEPPRRTKWASTVVPGLVVAGLLFHPPAHAGVSQLESHYRNHYGNHSRSHSGSPAPIANQPAESLAANFHDAFELGAAGVTKGLSLRESGTSLKFFFGEPVTKVPTQAMLKLSYAAPYLRPREARLDVMLNGTEAGSIALAPGPAQEIEFALPTDLLTSDNTLSLEMEGTCAACEPNSTAWVTLSPDSTIALDGTRLPLANDLSLLPLPFFDPAGMRFWSLPVIFSDPPDETTLEGAATVASWFGVLSDVRSVRFPVSVGEFPKGNALLFGVRGSRLLATLSLPSGHGPLLAMRDNPGDPYGKLLIVSGDNSGELLQAARALSSGRWMPHVSSLQPGVPAIAARQAYDAPRWLQAEAPSAIGTYTTAEHLKLQGTGSIDLYFRLPPDLFLNARQSVPLRLQFEYGGTPEGSRPTLNVRLNGKDVDSIRLKAVSSSVQESELFRLPTGSLLPYTNTLTIDFYFAASTPPASARPSFTIRQDSSLDLRGLPHSVVLPRLELFAEAGYPFTEWADASRTAVVLPNAPTPADVESMLDMAGFFGAQTGTPTTGLVVAHAANADGVQDKDLVVIGTPASQPLLPEWAGSMPLDLSESAMAIHEAPNQTLLLHPEWPFREYDAGRLESLLNGGTSNIDAYIEGFLSPLHRDRLVVAIDPAGAGGIDAVRALFSPPERQGPVYGGLAISRNGRFDSFLLGTQAWHDGEVDRYQATTILLFENYRLIPLLVLLLSLLIVAWVRWSTERIADARLAAWETNRDQLQ